MGRSRADRAEEALVVASRRGSDLVRRAASQRLIEARDPRSIDPVLLALIDRSSVVRFAAIQAVNTTVTDFFRVAGATENLRKLLGSKGLEARHPGRFRDAVQALEKVKPESSRQ